LQSILSRVTCCINWPWVSSSCKSRSSSCCCWWYCCSVWRSFSRRNCCCCCCSCCCCISCFWSISVCWTVAGPLAAPDESDWSSELTIQSGVAIDVAGYEISPPTLPLPPDCCCVPVNPGRTIHTKKHWINYLSICW